jgi:hypothetical protein
MNIAQRQLAAIQAAQAFRKAWAEMDAVMGFDASSDIAETRTLLETIQILETVEFLGVEE